MQTVRQISPRRLRKETHAEVSLVSMGTILTSVPAGREAYTAAMMM